MMIYPTLEILNGKCVTLKRGMLEDAEIWHVDPIERARSFAADGAEWMQLTDINGIMGENTNEELCQKIIRSAGIPVQFGGGFRTRDQITNWIDKGAGRIVVGTMAAHDPDLMRALSGRHPDQIVLAVDVYEGYVMTDGWRSRSSFTPETYVAAFDDCPLAGIIVTDIDADFADQDASLAVITGLAAQTRHPVIARGTIHGLDDVARLKYVKNVAGTLIGRALLSRDVDLVEALAIAREAREPEAEFQ